MLPFFGLIIFGAVLFLVQTALQTADALLTATAV
jgi:hypothetical protein